MTDSRESLSEITNGQHKYIIRTIRSRCCIEFSLASQIFSLLSLVPKKIVHKGHKLKNIIVA